MVGPFGCGHGSEGETWWKRARAALAISNFLRQHDLVQVLWVTLSPGNFPEHPSEMSSDIDRVS
jgi:hypothetical protein